MPYNSPKDIENRSYQPVDLRGGLNLTDSKYAVTPGTLQDCLNYEASDEGYTRSKGLWFYDGTWDQAIEDMWYITTTTGAGGESTLTGDGFTLGGAITWDFAGREWGNGIVAYWDEVTGPPDTITIGIINLKSSDLNTNNIFPADSFTLNDTTSGTTLALAGSMATAPSNLSDSAVADTISEYLAYINDTVNSSLVIGTTSTDPEIYHGKIPGTGAITGGFQFQDDVYAVRDYYSVGFENGNYEPGLDPIQSLVGTSINVDLVATGGVAAGTIAEVILTSGDWSTGDAEGVFILQPYLDTYDTWSIGISVAEGTLVKHNNEIYYCYSSHISAATTEPGIGATWATVYHIHYISSLQDGSDLTDGDEIFDQFRLNHSPSAKIANYLRANNDPRGALWKATTGGWQSVDMGYSMDFTDGQNAPSVRDAPLFVSNMLAVTKDDGAKDWGTPVNTGASPSIAWTTLANGTVSDDAYAGCTLGAGEYSQYLEGVIDTSSVPSANVRVVGVEVAVEAAAAASDVVDFDIVLSNAGTEWYISSNRAKAQEVATTDTIYTYGGISDIWGLDTINPQDILDGNISVRVQYYNGNAGARTMTVDNVAVTVHYVPEAEHVYIYDGTLDVSEADITAWQATNGEFVWGASPEPAGVFNLYNVTAPWAINSGMSIYTGPLGTGDLIATTGSTVVYNTLPGDAQMQEADSMYETIIANFFSDADAEAVYGVTGASPAFAFNGDFFSFIRTPLLQVADKPRHVEFHVNMLALGYETGHVLVSTVGAPHDFSGANGGTSWGFRDRITGLQALPGAVLAVLSGASIGSLEGTDPASMVQKNIQPSTGAREYTLQHIIQPYFMDNYGLGNVETSQKFGDFSFGRASEVVNPWLRGRLQNAQSTHTLNKTPIAAIKLRNKNQYRLYFNDGYILTATFIGGRGVEYTWQHYDTTNFEDGFVPRFLNSYVLESGRERAIMGTNDGSVYVIDGANIIQERLSNTEMDAYITINPINMGRPEAITKFHHTVVQGQFFGWQQLDAWADSNYYFDETGTAQATINIGSSSDATQIEATNNLDSVYLPILADGYSLKLQTSVDGSKPHTLQSLILRASLKGTDRNSTPKRY